MAICDRKDDYLYIRWAQEVKRRDHYTCVICGMRGVELNSHHLNAWNTHPDERYDIDNGVVLCKYHHDDFHVKYGRGGNTEEQFDEYNDICQMIIKAANRQGMVEAAVSKVSQDMERDNIVQDILADLEEKYASHNQ